MAYNFKPLNFYHKLPGELQDKYFDDIDYSHRIEADTKRHLHTASLFFQAVLTMDNETFENMGESGDGKAIKDASLFFIDPFHTVIMNNGLYEKYPEYVV